MPDIIVEKQKDRVVATDPAQYTVYKVVEKENEVGETVRVKEISENGVTVERLEQEQARYQAIIDEIQAKIDAIEALTPEVTK